MDCLFSFIKLMRYWQTKKKQSIANGNAITREAKLWREIPPLRGAQQTETIAFY
jgi:hypothetical protein